MFLMDLKRNNAFFLITRFVAILCVCFIAATPAAADNILINGSFETPIVPPDSHCGPFADCIGFRNGVGDSIGGWLVIGTSGLDSGGNPIPGAPSPVMLLGYNYVEPNEATGAVLNFHPQDGLQSVDLTGEGNQGPTNGIKQSVATVPGSVYDLSFWVGHQYSQAPGYLNGPGIVALYIDGQFFGDFASTGDTVNDITWQQFNFAFTAATDSTVIAFLNDTPIGNNLAGLDDVSLTAVPEPASVFLVSSGLLALLRARRKKN